MGFTLPNIGLTGGFEDEENGWGPAMNANLLRLSVLVQGGILGRRAAVPADPVDDGAAYVLTAAPNDKDIAVRTSGAWVYFTPAEGWMFYDKDTNEYITFDGAAWVPLQAEAPEALADAPQDGKLYARQDGTWVEVVIPEGGGGSSLPPIDGQALKFLRVNADESGLEWATAPAGGGGGGGSSGGAFAKVRFPNDSDSDFFVPDGYSPLFRAKAEIVEFDTAGLWDSAMERFNAPVGGAYVELYIWGKQLYTGNECAMAIRWSKAGVVTTIRGTVMPEEYHILHSGIVRLEEGDWIQPGIQPGNTTAMQRETYATLRVF